MSVRAVLLMCCKLLDIPLNNDEFRSKLPESTLNALENALEVAFQDLAEVIHEGER